MSEVLWNVASAVLGGGLIGSSAMAYVSIRKSHREDIETARNGEQQEADLVGTFRAMMVEELKAASKDKEEMREEIDKLRVQVRRLDGENYRTYELLRESSSYNNALLVHIAQHVSDGSQPPPMPRRLQVWQDEGR